MTEAHRTKLLAICGSTRTGSFNKMLMAEAIAAVESSVDVQIADLRSCELEMPLYCGDRESVGGLPRGAYRFRELLKSADALLFVTPEHNGSVSAVLKNALDWASRNETKQPSKDAFI